VGKPNCRPLVAVFDGPSHFPEAAQKRAALAGGPLQVRDIGGGIAHASAAVACPRAVSRAWATASSFNSATLPLRW